MSDTAKGLLQDLADGKATKQDLPTSEKGQSELILKALIEGRLFHDDGRQITANDMNNGFKRFKMPMAVKILNDERNG